MLKQIKIGKSARKSAKTDAATTPATTAETPATESKPVNAKREAAQAAYAAKAETCGAARSIARTVYAGPSLAVHASNRNKPLAAYLAVTATPKQRAASETDRDTSALVVAFKHCDKAHTFNPTDYAADLGAISRLSSLGYLTVSGDRIGLTETGLARARAASKA